MSNFRYRSLEAMEAEIRIRKMIDRAVHALYLQRGGDELDRYQRSLDEICATGGMCRAHELQRVQKNPQDCYRAKGERPLISVSEHRQLMAKAMYVMDRRNEVKASCRSEIMEAIARWEAKGEEETRALLDTLTGTISEATRKSAEAMKQAASAAEGELKAALGDKALLASEVAEELRGIFIEALDTGDMALVAEIVGQQPPQWQERWKRAV